jgi:hypothetical protein
VRRHLHVRTIQRRHRCTPEQLQESMEMLGVTSKLR